MTISKASEIADRIRSDWSCISYARDILGLPVFKPGDRCTSLAPGEHHHSNALIVHHDWWYDHTAEKGGDVIELCAYARHNGDRGAAFRELGANYFTEFTPTVFRVHSQSLADIIARWHKALRPVDRDYLHDRRITDETIERLQLGYCPDEKSGMFDRIIVPYWSNGRPVYYAGRDCSGKWKDKNSGVSKYKKMWTGKNEFSENTMWGLHTLGDDWCDDPEKKDILCILEGMFDAMSFEQEHWHVLSPIGGHFSSKMMPMVKSICKNFKKIYLCFDNDGPGVSFQRKMAMFCFTNRIPFICGHVGTEFAGKPIKDVSDYYTAGGSLEQLVDTAHEGIADLAGSFVTGDEKAFHDFIMRAARFVDKAELILLAKCAQIDAEFVKACLKEASKPPLEGIIAEEILSQHELIYSVNDSFYEYEHGVWQAVPMLAVQAYARELLGRKATSAGTASVAKHVSILRWNNSGFNQRNIINLMDGVLDLDTMKYEDHSPENMSTIQIPRPYDRDAECPKTLRFIEEIMDGVEDKMILLQQMAGNFFMRTNMLNKGFFLMGDGANGKSVLIELLRYVIDPRNCSNVELSDMADRFEPLRLRNSLVNFSSETRVDLKSAEAAIKKVISGETISAAHKGIDAVEFTPRCKIVCACNNFINSKDITYGFVRRMIFVPFTKTFTEKNANEGLLEELKAEAAGVLNWMIKGWHMLKESGRFIKTADDEKTREEFLVMANPLAGFIKMYLPVIIDAKLTTTDLYENHYVPWAKKTNTGLIGFINFSRQFKVLVTQMRPDIVRKRYNGKEYYIIKVKPDDAAPEWESL